MKTTRLAALLALAVPAIAYASCGSAFCTVNTNWTSQSALVSSGSSFDLRYEYLNQTQPYSGGDRIAVGAIPAHHDEVRTDNRNAVATYSRSFDGGWGLSVSAPVGKRDHAHIHNHHGAKLNDNWSFTELGDVRVLGRYQFETIGDPLKPSSTGLLFGAKLPTGQFDVHNAANAVAERSLQPGAGTTDLIVGAYHHQKLAVNASWFAQVQYQHALNTRDGFKPGAQASFDVGYRHGVSDRLGLLVQLNAVHKRSDQGSEAEPASSGGRYMFASPGVSYAVTENVQVYGFYQHALYRHVTGVQLTAPRAFVLGVTGRL